LDECSASKAEASSVCQWGTYHCCSGSAQCKLVCNNYVFIIGLTNLHESLTDLSDKYIDNSLHLVQKYACHGYFSVDIIRSEKQTVFQQHSSRKTVGFNEEQIISIARTNIVLIFVPNGGYNLFIILQIFSATHAVLNLGNITWIFPSFSCGIFSHIMHYCTKAKIFDGL